MRLFKLLIQGIVYLVDPDTAYAYLYEADTSSPTRIGTVVWTNPGDEPRIELVADWRAVQAAKLDASQYPHLCTHAASGGA